LNLKKYEKEIVDKYKMLVKQAKEKGIRPPSRDEEKKEISKMRQESEAQYNKDQERTNDDEDQTFNNYQQNQKLLLDEYQSKKKFKLQEEERLSKEKIDDAQVSRIRELEQKVFEEKQLLLKKLQAETQELVSKQYEKRMGNHQEQTQQKLTKLEAFLADETKLSQEQQIQKREAMEEVLAQELSDYKNEWKKLAKNELQEKVQRLEAEHNKRRASMEQKFVGDLAELTKIHAEEKRRVEDGQRVYKNKMKDDQKNFQKAVDKLNIAQQRELAEQAPTTPKRERPHRKTSHPERPREDSLKKHSESSSRTKDRDREHKNSEHRERKNSDAQERKNSEHREHKSSEPRERRNSDAQERKNSEHRDRKESSHRVKKTDHSVSSDSLKPRDRKESSNRERKMSIDEQSRHHHEKSNGVRTPRDRSSGSSSKSSQ